MDREKLIRDLAELCARTAADYSQEGIEEIGEHVFRFDETDVLDVLPCVIASALRGEGDGRRFKMSDLVSLLDVGSFDGRTDLDGYRLFGDKLGVKSRMSIFSEVEEPLTSLIVRWLEAVESEGTAFGPEEELPNALRYWRRCASKGGETE